MEKNTNNTENCKSTGIGKLDSKKWEKVPPDGYSLKGEKLDMAESIMVEAVKMLERKAINGFKPRVQIKARCKVAPEIAKAIRICLTTTTKDKISLEMLGTYYIVCTKKQVPIAKRAKALENRINKLTALKD